MTKRKNEIEYIPKAFVLATTVHIESKEVVKTCMLKSRNSLLLTATIFCKSIHAGL